MAKPAKPRAVRKAPPRAPRKRVQTPQPAEQPMEIHKPKPIHNWRELASEVGVIVIGILIALGLEQAVEAYRARERSETAKHAIEAELRFSAAKAEVLSQMVDCSERQMAAISNAIGRGDQAEVERLVAGSLLPRTYTWSEAAWQNALASDASEHFNEQERRSFSIVYGIVAVIHEKQEDYSVAQDRLRAIALSGLARSPLAPGAELSEMAQMASALSHLQDTANTYRERVKTLLGIVPRQEDFAALPELDRAARCVAAAAALERTP